VSIEDAIYSRLSTFAGLIALTSARIYPLLAPQTVATPFVAYQRISGSPESLLTSDTNVRRDRWQITCFSPAYSEVTSVADQVLLALQRWQGVEVGVTIEDSFLENEIDFYEEKTKLFQVAIDFEILHRG